ncbi:Neutral/alkaline nonlysosomal ceramidase [Mycena amicta]|nr:Neutral/alkaline nonlysosomal ceramidase [Mycena amicta]
MRLPFFPFVLSPLDSLHAVSSRLLYLLLPSSLFGSSLNTTANSTNYLLGLGIADITGPVVEMNLMGYAALPQTGTGLYMRQRVRAFVVAEPGASGERVLLLNADIGMGDTGVRRALLSALSQEFGNETYHAGNVAFVGTHQHSGVGGYLENLLPQLTALGFSNQSFSAIVTGSLRAARRAHASLAPGTLSVGSTRVEQGSRNRSPTAYLANPAAERARYKTNGGADGDQEWNMSVLRFDGASGQADGRGFLGFFAVHGTSVYENNTLVNGDNKGMAAYLYESSIEPQSMPGRSAYVAGFVQGAVGDTSPNTLGAFCESPGKPYNGLPCVANSSTCGGTVQDCHGRGPAFSSDAFGFASSEEIGRRQADGVKNLLHSGGSALSSVHGAVRSVHVYVDMSKHEFVLPNGTTVRTCPAAMGYSFAGGTTDGPGAFDFIQGDNKTSQNPFWEVVKRFITPAPPEEQIECQYPKPILLNVGYAHEPYEWSPSTVDVQILRIGNFVILVIPGELTTMSGRRMREAVRAKLISEGILGEDAHVVVAGPANTYSHYITTPEEYAVQRYEGASTLYGPHTLDAYLDRYTSLVPFLADDSLGKVPASDPAPEEQTSKAISLKTSVKFDEPPLGRHFGEAVQDVKANYTYKAGETVSVRFVGANPRNNLRLEQTFLNVEQLVKGTSWVMVRSDSHPSTRYHWTRDSTVLGTSSVDISWTIESATTPGTYRIRYFGDSKAAIGGEISPFVGTSGNFTVG